MDPCVPGGSGGRATSPPRSALIHFVLWCCALSITDGAWLTHALTWTLPHRLSFNHTEPVVPCRHNRGRLLASVPAGIAPGQRCQRTSTCVARTWASVDISWVNAG